MAAVASPARADESPFEAGFIAGGHFFSSELELGVQDLGNQPTPKSFALFGARLGYHFHPRIGLEAEVVAVPTESSFDNGNVFVLGARGHLVITVATFGSVSPFLVAGAGTLTSFSDGTAGDQIGKDTDLAVHWGGGLRIALSKNLFLRADARHIIAPSRGDNEVTSDLELQLGLAFRFGGASAPAPKTDPPKPPAAADSDGDGIDDKEDLCPEQPEDMDTFEDTDGCPDPDNDKDGIADGDDQCPDEAESQNGIDDEDGCPETDNDGDGLLGSQDKCPEEAEDADSFQDDDGCPDPDNDGDGVLDADDRCPTQLETKNGYKDEDGCPDTLPRAIKRFTGVIAGIRFRKNSANISSASFSTLKRAVKVLNEYKTIRLEISGHTSSEGDRDKNIELSWQRAESVKKYLVDQGVDAARITTVGYGPDKPRASNKRRSGRSKNRRIEFRILTQGEGEAGATPPGSGGDAAPGDSSGASDGDDADATP